MSVQPPAAAELPDTADAVTVAYVNSNQVTFSWHKSMVELIGWDLANHARIMRGGYLGIRAGTGGLVEARNKAIIEFLTNRDADWLFWIDTDMGFPADTVDQLLAVADPQTRPVVGGLCFSQREGDPDGLGGFATAAAPTIYDWAKVTRTNPDGTERDEQGFLIRLDYPRDSVIRAAGTGSACILIHRSVLMQIGEKFGPVWYDRIPNNSIGELTSEDLSFCMRLGMLDIPLYIHTGVKTTHMKTQWVGEDEFLRQQPPPPAVDEVAVIVPVTGRPQRAEPFMRSLRASTGLAEAYAIVDEADHASSKAWQEAGATVLTAPAALDDTGIASFAQKVNRGARYVAERWLMLVGDDVVFRPGWYDRAIRAAGDRYTVVGTNDLGNPRVTAGEHATHLLIRRDYIEQVGASWDGPGVVCHEGYRHWYVDDEIVTAAKQRGRWTMARDSVVEHLHPLFGKAEDDPVYALGRSFAAKDQSLFEARLTEFGS